MSVYVDKVCSLLTKANVQDPLTGFAALFNGLPEDIKIHIMMDQDEARLTKNRLITLLKTFDSLKLKKKKDKLPPKPATFPIATPKPEQLPTDTTVNKKANFVPFFKRKKRFSDPVKKTYWKCIRHKTDNHSDNECRSNINGENDTLRQQLDNGETSAENKSASFNDAEVLVLLDNGSGRNYMTFAQATSH